METNIVNEGTMLHRNFKGFKSKEISTSSNITGMGILKENSDWILRIEFGGKNVYNYRGLTADQILEFAFSESYGKHFSEQIKNNPSISTEKILLNEEN